MEHPSPRLEIFPLRIEENARNILSLIQRHGASAACVTKATCAHPALTHALCQAGAQMLADSRLDNLNSIRQEGVSLPLMLLRSPAPAQANAVIDSANISLNSSLTTLQALSAATQRKQTTHQVILMIDLGDLREGIWPNRAVETARAASLLPGLEILGLGTNLACFGGVIPTRQAMLNLVEIRDQCRRVTGLPLDMISGGNSASLPLLSSGEMPPEINHFRIGESILLGRNVLDRTPFPNTRQDTFRLVAEIIEVEEKPSVPLGPRAQDAFGQTPHFPERGIRRRAICSLGRQDTLPEGLTPEEPGIEVLGASSDHLLLDIEESPRQLRVGDEIAFTPGYGALLAASTSPYVRKIVIQG